MLDKKFWHASAQQASKLVCYVKIRTRFPSYKMDFLIVHDADMVILILLHKKCYFLTFSGSVEMERSVKMD